MYIVNEASHIWYVYLSSVTSVFHDNQTDKLTFNYHIINTASFLAQLTFIVHSNQIRLLDFLVHN